MKRSPFAAAVAVLMTLVAAACAKKEAPAPPEQSAAPPPAAAPAPVPFSVVSIDLGKSITDGRTIKEAATTFAPHDTIYAAVSTVGTAAKATLKARWTYGAKETLVNEESRDISPTGPAVTEFHVAKPSGWPVGKYKVEISADGNPAGTKEFEVAK